MDHSGMECPKCGCKHLVKGDGTRRFFGFMVRYRRCRNCGQKVRTKEHITHVFVETEDENDTGKYVSVPTRDSSPTDTPRIAKLG